MASTWPRASACARRTPEGQGRLACRCAGYARHRADDGDRRFDGAALRRHVHRIRREAARRDEPSMRRPIADAACGARGHPVDRLGQGRRQDAARYADTRRRGIRCGSRQRQILRPGASALSSRPRRTGVIRRSNLVAKIGRASRLGERSLGVLDAGATSCAIILKELSLGARGRLQ